MSKRLQVILADQELREIQRIAKRHRLTVAEWVRQTLRAGRRSEPTTDARKKLDVIRVAARQAFPTGDIEQVLEEIDRGYLQNVSQ